MAYDVLVFYGALAVWAVLLAQGARTKQWMPFIGFGLLLTLVVNLRYFVEGAPASIAFFIGIYDVFDNLGLSTNEGAAALASCPDNACTVWGDRYVQHPSWGVAFHDRFVNGTSFRSGLLYAHIGFNSIALVLLHLQLWKPGTGANRNMHRVMGRMAFAAITLGTICAVWLASEHGDVGDYGGVLSQLGFYSMSFFVYGAAIMSVLTVRRGDVAAHRIWTWRWVGAMWGAFWLFRVMLVVTGPLLRNWNTLSLQLSIWLSAPLGILLAEYIRKRRNETPATAGPAPAELASSGV